MSMQDPIADMLVRIKNAQAVRKKYVDIPQSKIKKAIAEVLQQEGFVEEIEDLNDDNKPQLRLYLKYHNRQAVIEKLERVSKPSKRIYCSKDEIPRVENGMGIAVLSTSNGVISDHQARKLGCGGELICYVS